MDANIEIYYSLINVKGFINIVFLAFKACLGRLWVYSYITLLNESISQLTSEMELNIFKLSLVTSKHAMNFFSTLILHLIC